jgi:hypothetical protein
MIWASPLLDVEEDSACAPKKDAAETGKLVAEDDDEEATDDEGGNCSKRSCTMLLA